MDIHAAELLEEAAAILEEGGHTKGELVKWLPGDGIYFDQALFDRKRPHCVAGALMCARGNSSKALMEPARLLAFTLLEAPDGTAINVDPDEDEWQMMVAKNNHPDATPEAVIAWCRRAAERARA